MLAWPASRRMVRARFRNAAMTRGAAGGADLGAVLIEVHVADPVKAVLDGPVAADDGGEPGGAGLGGGQRGDSVAGLGGPLPAAQLAAADDLDGLGGTGEGQPGGHDGHLERAPLGPPVPALAGLAGDWHLAPGQGRELGEQARLVAFDGEQVMRAAPGQVAGVGALGVHRVGCHDGSVDGDAI